MKNIFYLIFCIILFFSCKSKNQNKIEDKYPHLNNYNLETKKVDNHFSILIPSFLDPAPDEIRKATIHYVMLESTLFLMVLENTKENILEISEKSGYKIEEGDSLIDVFALMMGNGMKKKYINSTLSKTKKTLINACDTRIISVTGTLEKTNHKITLSTAIISGKKNIYVISTHCLAEDYVVYKDIFEQCINSFEILGSDLPDAITTPYIKDEAPRSKKTF